MKKIIFLLFAICIISFTVNAQDNIQNRKQLQELQTKYTAEEQIIDDLNQQLKRHKKKLKALKNQIKHLEKTIAINEEIAIEEPKKKEDTENK
jgi:septal ring factor EnvC (AmiA/AmiB activator)